MPVHTPISIPRLSKERFGRASYEVLGHVFEIHRQFGRFFNERIYKQELALRMPEVRLEVPLEVIHGTFAKRYFLDVVLLGGGIFEFKAVEEICARHRGQLLNYLLLLDVAHGQLINLRAQEVEHEFVNAVMTTEQRKRFTVERRAFDDRLSGGRNFACALLPLLSDLGTGLDIVLYEEAMTALLGGEGEVIREIEVIRRDARALGRQRLRMCSKDSAFKLTMFPNPPPSFAEHCKRLLCHVGIQAIHWANIANELVTLSTITKAA